MHPVHRRRGWRTRLGTNSSFGLSALALTTALAGSCAGASDELVNQALTAAREVPVFELSTGVCFNSETLTVDTSDASATDGAATGDPGADEPGGESGNDNVTSIDVVECSEPHRFQVFATVIHDCAAGAPFDNAAISADAQDQCDDGFEAAVGRTFEDSPDLELLPLRPSEASWQAGDRTTFCIAFPGDRTAFPDESLLIADRE